MQRARRLASVVSVVLVGVLALGACGRSAPDVAAYVGDTRYSQADVNQVVNEIKDQVKPEQLAAVRQTVVQMFVLREVATSYAKAHNISVPASDPAAFAQQSGLPPNVRFTELAAGTNAAVGAVRQPVQSVAPSEADQREAHSHSTSQGQPITDSFESVRQFFDEKALGKAVGVRNLLRDAVGQAHVSVNPRYGDLTYQVPVQIGQVASWLAVPLTGKEPAVSDVTVKS
jgi:hypothetical protein